MLAPYIAADLEIAEQLLAATEVRVIDFHKRLQRSRLIRDENWNPALPNEWFDAVKITPEQLQAMYLQSERSRRPARLPA